MHTSSSQSDRFVKFLGQFCTYFPQQSVKIWKYRKINIFFGLIGIAGLFILNLSFV